MNTQPSMPLRSRSEIVSDLHGVTRAISGKITKKQKRLKDGRIATYHQLQQWTDGRNVTTHIPEDRLGAFVEAVAGRGKLDTLVSELSSVDTQAILKGQESKKKRMR